MAIENFDEVKSYIEQNKDSEDVKGYVNGFINFDNIKSFLETNNDGKGYLQSYTDSKVTKAIKTFEESTLPKKVEEELKRRNPSLDERDLKIQELEKKFEESEKAKTRESLTNKALKMAQEKKLPVDLVNYFLGQDEQSTIDNLSTLESALQSYSQQIKNEILKEGSYVPPKDDKGLVVGTVTQAEYNKNKNNLDWYAKNKEKVMESYKLGLIK